MASTAAMNPLRYIINRQYNDCVKIKNKLFNERLAKARNLYRKDLYAHYGCVNAIEFSDEGELLVSGGDDRRVLLWSVPEIIHDRGAPVIMREHHISNIFCVSFDSRNSKIFSGGNDDQVILHDIHTCNLITKLPHRKPVYGLSINPQNDDVLATAGDDGRILIFDVRETSAEAQCLAKQKTGFHSVMFNPTNPRFLVTANSEEGIALWDCRKPKDVLVQYDSTGGKISGISACFDRSGKQLLALRRRLPPVLYATQSETAICQFYHPQYYNSCTMKTCCFAGDNDEYILSGSDDFNLYMWQIPRDGSEWGTSHVVLKGHRSIVNQVRYNKHNNLIASSGVEKMVKLWTTLPIGTWRGSLVKEYSESSRAIYTHDDYMQIVGATGERISHDYSDQSTLEDSKMMAFFDSLIQREIEGWESPAESLSTDSDSDGQSQYWTNLITEIYHTRHKNFDEAKKHNKTNTIAHLIYKKRHCLAKMAHDKSRSAIRRYHLKEKSRKRKNFVKDRTAKSPKNGKRPENYNALKHESRKQKSDVEGGSRLRKYRTRQSVKDICESSASNNSIDAPSTSTGITSSASSTYRVIEQDSDDELPPNTLNCNENITEEVNNFVNILPTPLNGTHDLFVNALETSTEVVSTGHAPLPSTSAQNTYQSDTDSDFDDYQLTPVKKRRTVSASDSGCATGPCSSSSLSKKNNQNNNHRQECSFGNGGRSSDEEYVYEKFRKSVKKARLNLRKQIGAESDSN